MENIDAIIKYYQENGFGKTIKEFGITKFKLYKILEATGTEKYYKKKTKKKNNSWYDSLPADEEEYKEHWKNYKKDTSWLSKYIKYDLNGRD